MRSRFYKSLTAVIIVIVAIFFIINVVMPTKTFSDKENRNLAQRPSISVSGLSDGQYFTDYDRFYSDQFFLRDTLMSIKFKVEHFFGKKEFSDVFIGSDGYLLAKPTVLQEEVVNETARAINDFIANHPGIKVSLIMVASSTTVYSDKLPAAAQARDQMADIEYFQSKLHGVNIIDVNTKLMEERDEYIYYRTDHHWTSLGAFKAFEVFRDAYGLSADVTYKALPVTKSFQGTLASATGDFSEDDTIAIYKNSTDVDYYVTYPASGTESGSIYMKDKLSEKDKYQVFFGGNYPRIDIKTTADNGKKILIFKDSYANCFAQFLLPYYEDIIIIDPRYYYDNVDTILSTQGIQDIVLLYSSDTMIGDTSLAAALNVTVPENSQKTQ